MFLKCNLTTQRFICEVEEIMRKLVSIFVFSVALFIGLFSIPSDTPTLYEKIYPSFSQSEADSLLGRRVKNKSLGKTIRGMKYPINFNNRFAVTESPVNKKEKIVSEEVQIGETGQVIGLYKRDVGFGVIIKWYEQAEVRQFPE